MECAEACPNDAAAVGAGLTDLYLKGTATNLRRATPF